MLGSEEGTEDGMPVVEGSMETSIDGGSGTLKGA